MNKIVIVISIVALITAGIGWRVYSQTTSSTTPTDNSKISDDPNTMNQFKGSLIDLVKLGQNYTCTFDNTDETGNVTTGRVYIAESGNKMNGEFETILASDGSTTTTNIITDSTYSYVWSNQMEQAYKYPVNNEENSLFGVPEDDSKDKNATQAIDDKQNIEFDCNRWNVDNSMFIPPSDIEFVDIQAQMDQMQQKVPEEAIGNSNISCATCDQVPEGDAKEQCLQALGCN